MGTVWRNRVYATSVREIPGFALTIVHLEMFNVLLALRVWGKKWRHSSVRILCYNCCPGGQNGQDEGLVPCALHKKYLLYDINLVIDHILGKKNRLADTLSRICSSKLVNENILQDLLTHHQRETIVHSHFDLSLHI